MLYKKCQQIKDLSPEYQRTSLRKYLLSILTECLGGQIHYWEHKMMPAAHSGCTFALLQEGLLYLPKQPQEFGRDTRRWAQGALDMAVPRSRTSVCSFVGGETGEALPEPYKTPSSRLLMCMFLAILSETDYMSMGSGPSIIYCAHSSAPFRTEQRSVATCKTCKSIPVLGGISFH